MVQAEAVYMFRIPRPPTLVSISEHKAHPTPLLLPGIKPLRSGRVCGGIKTPHNVDGPPKRAPSSSKTLRDGAGAHGPHVQCWMETLC